jgi:hypothetical protein
MEMEWNGMNDPPCMKDRQKIFGGKEGESQRCPKVHNRPFISPKGMNGLRGGQPPLPTHFEAAADCEGKDKRRDGILIKGFDICQSIQLQ